MMNYVEQINVFWKLDAEHSFNGNESRLYFYLLNLSNSLYWKNPLTNADGYTASVVGISVNTLKSIRNRLQQAGLISFKPGGNGSRNKCLYHIVPAAQVIRKNADKVSNSDTLLNESLTPYCIPGLEKTDDIIKHKQNKTKTISSAPASPAPKKNVLEKKKKTAEKETEPYWQELMAIFFTTYKSEHKGEEPSMEGRDPKLFKDLIQKLKKRAARKKYEWTLDNATGSLKYFLDRAIKREWLRTHLTPKNLVEQFDIVYQEQLTPAEKKELPKVHVHTGPKSFEQEMSYLFGRFCEDDFNQAIILPEYYDKMVTHGHMQVGTMTKYAGTYDQQKVAAVIAFLNEKKSALNQLS